MKQIREAFVGVVKEEEAVRAMPLDRSGVRSGGAGFHKGLGFRSNLDEEKELIVRGVCGVLVQGK